MSLTHHTRRRLAARINRAIQFTAGQPAGAEQVAVLTAPSGDISITTQPFSLAARFRVDADTGNYQWLFGNSYNASAQYSFLYYQGQLLFDSYFYNSTGDLILYALPVPIQLGTWYDVTFTYDTQAYHWHLNGQHVQSQAASFFLTPMPSDVLRLGLDFTIYPASATIDYVEVYRGQDQIIYIDFAEAAGDFTNSGSAGGTIELVNNPTVLVL